MKLGVRGHDLGVTDVSDIIKICKKNNIGGLQLVVNKTWESLYNERNLSEIVSRIKTLQAEGIEIFLLGTYFNPIHPNSKSVTEGIEKVRFNLEIANECGLKFLGSETGSLNGDSWTYNKDNHSLESFAKVLEVFSSFKTELIEHEKNFLIEPVYDHVIYDTNRLFSLLGGLNSENYLVTFDLANLLNTENYVDYEKITDDFLKSHNNKIRLMHFKNFVIKDNKKVGVRLEQGVIDYTKIIELLEKHDLKDVPCIIEELEGEDLISSVNYIYKIGGVDVNGL